MDENDSRGWLDLRKQLWDRVDEEVHVSEMLGIYKNPETQLILVADAGGGNIVGFLEASIRPFVEDCHTDHVGYLEGWYVLPEHRRRGIGLKLVEGAERWAVENGCVEMASDSEVGNELSLEAHLSFGYKETSRLVHLRKNLA